MENLIYAPVEEAKTLLAEAEQLNPGAWVDHAKVVGRCARRIAEACGMDPDKAESLGLTHDIGRRFGLMQMRHVVLGYQFLSELGYEANARVAITHSFPNADVRSVFGDWDVSSDELMMVSDFLNEQTFDDYDRLIQLCDALSLPQGVVLIEKRMVDVALRYGVSQYTIPKWEETMDIKAYFDRKCGCSIYELFPEIAENSLQIAV